MALRINKYIREPKKAGITSIYYSVVWNCNRLIVQAGDSIHTSDWDNKKYQPKQKADTAMLTGRLNKLEQKIRDDFEALVKTHGIDAVKPKMLKDRVIGKTNIKPAVPQKKEQVLMLDFLQRMIDDT